MEGGSTQFQRNFEVEEIKIYRGKMDAVGGALLLLIFEKKIIVKYVKK